jgi:hypothetical protein
MKDKIIEILDKYKEYVADNTHDGYYVDEDDFEQIADEIERLYKNKTTERETIYIKESPQDDYEFSLMRRSDDSNSNDTWDEPTIKHFQD